MVTAIVTGATWAWMTYAACLAIAALLLTYPEALAAKCFRSVRKWVRGDGLFWLAMIAGCAGLACLVTWFCTGTKLAGIGALWSAALMWAAVESTRLARVEKAAKKNDWQEVPPTLKDTISFSSGTETKIGFLKPTEHDLMELGFRRSPFAQEDRK